MAPSALLVVETAALRVEIRGPVVPLRVSALGLSAPPAHLVVDAHGVDVTVECSDDAGALRTWLPNAPGPRFFEATRYQLIAVARAGGPPPRIAHRDPSLIRDVVEIDGQPVTFGALDFHEQVGLSDFTVRVGPDSIDFTIEVFPTKLDYATDYRHLLRDVAAAARGLAFEYLRSTYARVGTEHAETPTGLEWMALVRRYVRELEDAVRFVDARPRRALRRDFSSAPIERVRGNDAALRLAVIRGSGTGPWVDVPELGRVRARVPARRVEETLDTTEHRWIKHHLTVVCTRLAEIATEVADEVNGMRRAGQAPSARLTAEYQEIREAGDRVERLLGLPLFADVRTPAGAPEVASLTLLTAPGYAETYARLMALRLGLNVHGDALDLSTKELDVLYETWCFIRLAHIMVGVAGTPPVVHGLVSVDAAGVRVRLRRGQQSSVATATTARELVLSYNRSFLGLTGTQRPDIVLELRHAGWPEIIIVFDAKYRVDASEVYVEKFLAPGPPIDAVNALHRYRDAIVLGAPESPRGRPVVKGVALFPLVDARAAGFEQLPLYRALDVLGIGALPFLPDCTSLVEKWLTALLRLEPEVLALPGPPWLAHEHLRS